MPWIDDQIELDNPIVAGDVINLGNGEVTFVPAVGWDLLSGTLLVEGDTTTSVPTSATLLSDTVSYSAKSGNWDGTAEELLDQVIDVNESLDDLGVKDEQDRISITNADGVPGRTRLPGRRRPGGAHRHVRVRTRGWRHEDRRRDRGPGRAGPV